MNLRAIVKASLTKGAEATVALNTVSQTYMFRNAIPYKNVVHTTAKWISKASENSNRSSKIIYIIFVIYIILHIDIKFPQSLSFYLFF